jgi:hypothetical protein
LTDVDAGAARALVNTAMAEHGARPAPEGVWLDESSAMELLDAYRIPTVATSTVPPTGVDMVAEAVLDPLFGPLVAFGTGGPVGQLMGDRAFRALPLTDVDARDLIGSIRGAPLLRGTDLSALEDLLLRVGRLVEDLPELADLILDPLIVSRSGVWVGGVRAHLSPWEPRPERALRRIQQTG